MGRHIELKTTVGASSTLIDRDMLFVMTETNVMAELHELLDALETEAQLRGEILDRLSKRINAISERIARGVVREVDNLLVGRPELPGAYMLPARE